MRRTRALGAIVLCSMASAQGTSGSGSPDLSFGTRGTAVVDFGGDDLAYALALQRDGKIVVAGWTTEGRRRGFDAAVARLTPRGRVDPSFGARGETTVDFGGRDAAWAVAISPDGKILLAGSTTNGSRHDDFAVARLRADGSIDQSFGKDGKVTIDFGGYESARAAALEPDGDVVVGGSGGMARLKPTGALDASFGAGGTISEVQPGAILVQPDGTFVVTGGSRAINAPQVTRLGANGELDASFGNGGTAVVDLGRNPGREAIARQPDGKLVVAAGTVVTRLAADGSLDRSFGSRGKTAVRVADLVAVDADGSIVVAGTVAGKLTVTRLSKDGAVDGSFGSGGVATVAARHGYTTTGLAVQRDGKIVAGGTAPKRDGFGDFAVVRLRS